MVGAAGRNVRMVAVAIVATFVATFVATPSAPATGTAPVPAVTSIDRNSGVDISWPECPTDVGIPGRMGQAKPPPPATTGFVVLGLTNGPGFHVNPCIDSQLAWIRAHRTPLAVYAMTTYPTPADVSRYGASGPYRRDTLAGRLANAGRAEARFNVATMRSKGIRVRMVWIDVETYHPWNWSPNHARNAAVLTGVMNGYLTAGYRIGFYSSVYMWRTIIGTGGPRGYPEWRTVGARSASVARTRCTSGSFQGGRAVLVQYWTALKDYDETCAGYRTAAARRSLFAVTA
jgi:hypothetical protein